MHQFHFIQYWLIILGILIWSMGCDERNPAKGKINERDSLASQPIQKPPSPSNDSLFIKQKAAVLFSLDSVRWLIMKGKMGHMSYESAKHECFYQMKNTRTSLNEYWPQLQVFDVNTVRFLVFVGNNNLWVIDLNASNDLCGTYLFDPRKSPILADMMNIGTELDFYFKR